jgi:hypothetical protein
MRVKEPFEANYSEIDIHFARSSALCRLTDRVKSGTGKKGRMSRRIFRYYSTFSAVAPHQIHLRRTDRD